MQPDVEDEMSRFIAELQKRPGYYDPLPADYYADDRQSEPPSSSDDGETGNPSRKLRLIHSDTRSR